MSKYLYGATVQGIQGFIFQTNELKDIVGASELVEEICTTEFDEFCKNGAEKIIGAAGNVKCIYNNEEDCRRAVLEFPKKVMTRAPGITISEAVVKMDGKYSNFADAVLELEELLREQRNKPAKRINSGLMGMLRSRKTGLPATCVDNGDFLDESTEKKRLNAKKGNNNSTIKLSRKNFGINNLTNDQICYDIEDMVKDNDWIAVIHADGNGLGQIVQQFEDAQKYQNFSKNLDTATMEAAQTAFQNTCIEFGISLLDKLPFRPIVLSGDDHTIICRGDLAMTYVKEYLAQFELKTKEKLGLGYGLTACAGVAYIKSSYPFYYGYDLAESLCAIAKRDAKSPAEVKEGKILPKSCLMFYKVQDSFVEEYSDIAERELTPRDNLSFEYGPYYLEDTDGRWTISHLIEQERLLNDKDGNAVKSDLRRWLTEMYRNPESAKQISDRTLSLLNSSYLKNLVIECTDGQIRNGKTCYPVYDLLALHSISSIKTK